MKLRNKILDIFRGQFPNLIEKLEEELYFYLEELLLQKDIVLDQEIDYRNPDFRNKLHDMVDALSSGLSMIGVTKGLIEHKFKAFYRYFKTDKSLKTYKDWLYEEFKGKINKLLFNEILNYFVEQNHDIVDNLIQLGLIDETIKKKLDKINKKYSRLSKFLSTPEIVKQNLLNTIFKDGAIKELFKFENPFDDLRSLYFIYVLATFYDLNHRINLSPSVQFLVGEVEKWSSEIDDVSLLNPLTLYCGLYLTDSVDIDIDQATCKKNLKSMIVNTVQLQDDPIFKNPYLIYYIVKSMKLLKLKLTPKFLDGLVAKTESSTSMESLRKLSTDQLGTISQLYQELGFKPKLDADDRKNFVQVFEERENEGVYCTTSGSESCSIESIWGSLDYFIENNGLNKIDFGACLDYLLNDISGISNHLIVKSPKMLGRLVLGLQLLEKIDSHFDTTIITELEKFIFNEVRQTQKKVPKEIIDDLIKDANKPKFQMKEVDLGGDQEVLSDMSDMEAEFEDELNKLTEMDSEGLDEGDQDVLDDLGVPSLDEEDDFLNLMDQDLSPVSIDKIDEEPEEKEPKEDIVEPLPNRPIDIANYICNPPNISLDFIKNLNINYNSVVKPPILIKNDLKDLYHLIVIEKLLRLKHSISADEIESICSKSYTKNGFGITRFPDLENTYYGLYIYHAYDILDRIDMYAIHEYLLEEVNHFKPFNLSNNHYLLASLKILEKYDIPMAEYQALVDKMLNTDYVNTDDFNPLYESFDYTFIVRILSPKTDISKIRDRFKLLLDEEIQMDGSINGTVTDTSKVLITMGLFDMFDEEIEKTNDMVNYLITKSELFSEALKDQNVSWANDTLGLSVEFNIAYWCLMALMCYRPVRTKNLHPNICAGCGTYFDQKPKFCNMCGNKFI